MTNTLIAVSGDKEAVTHLFANGFTGRVWSVFRHTVNVVGQNDEMYALTANAAANAPATVRLRAEADFSFLTLNIYPGAAVFTAEQTLRLEDKIMVAGNEIKPWECKLPPFPREKQLAGALKLLRKLIAEDGVDGGLKAYITGCTGQNGFMTAELTSRALQLRQKFLQRDLPAALEAGKQLLGLGQGSTPSGDDFLTGLILVITLSNSPLKEQGELFAQTIASTATQATTRISARMLYYAAKGQVQETVASLLEAIYYEEERMICQARQVIALGGLSGTDILAGMITGFELGLQECKQRSGDNG